MCATLPALAEREVKRCERCQLVQYPTIKKRLCRRCHAPLDPPQPDRREVIAAPIAPQGFPRERRDPSQSTALPQKQLAMRLKWLRLRSGLSQKQLAMRLGSSRAQVCRVENQQATPTLSSLYRLASSLEVTMAELLGAGPEAMREAEMRQLLRDPFIRTLLPFIPRLSKQQRAKLLRELCGLTGRWHRS